jgi:hypothetical protein
MDERFTFARAPRLSLRSCEFTKRWGSVQRLEAPKNSSFDEKNTKKMID